ncbi:MAG: murein biosynthesis integral membrane protein MurJ [Candidatus Viridilinea halotolerans]|uniref:Probable lipid II flippase MurJ n=1 Tax=Candidatus Viridilinea halotolerans TaxID=2491704 RepID=A0A426TY07_9CHLR|nr:MAG: murein biosynthesis integral membrane protein MurJ [Candidatus Viridilinea halotolerans]
MQLFALLRRARSGALGSSLVVMGGFVLSRLTGLLRDMVATYVYGTSAEAAAYRAAFSVVDLLYLVIIGGALGSSFIPVFIELWEREGQARAWRLASAVVTWALIVLTLASGLLLLAAPWLVTLIYGGRGFDAATLALTAQLTRLFLLSPLLLGLGGLAMAALNARERFALPALAPTIYNLGIIAGALVGPTFGLGIWGMAWGVVLGALGYLLVQIPGLRGLGMRLRLNLGRGMAEVGRIARQMGPRVLGQAAAHISIVVTLALTARLDDGAAKLAGLGYAYQLMLLPFGIFSLSLSQVAFPRLARLVAEGRHAELAADLRRTLALILWLTLPASAVLLALGFPLARVLFERGAYDATSLHYTVSALWGYSLALPAFAASEILIRGFYAMQRTWTPVLIGLLQVGLNLALGMFLLRNGGDVGSLALAFSVANNLEAVLLLLLMGRALPGIWHDATTWRTVGVALLGALLLGLGLTLFRVVSYEVVPALSLSHTYIWLSEMWGLLLWLGLAGGLGAVGYVALSFGLGAAPARAVKREGSG